MPLLDVLEQGFPSAQDDWLNHDPKFIDQSGVDQAGHQRRAADGMHVLAGLLFQRAKVFDVPNDPSVLPADLVQRP